MEHRRSFRRSRIHQGRAPPLCPVSSCLLGVSMLDTMPVAHPEPIAPAADPAPRRRQWGAEKRSEPMSIVHPKPTGRKIVLGRLGIITTVAAWIVYVVTTI